MSPNDRESREVRESESGVHRRCSRVLVIEPDQSARGQWDVTAEVHHVEFVGSPKTLPRALNGPGEARAVSVALAERVDPAARVALVQGLGRVGGLRDQRLIIDVRRCDLPTALELLGFGFILCADDEVHHGSAPRAAVNHTTMADELGDSAARTRLAKTLAATAISDEYDLSGGEHRAFRGLMDYGHATQLAAVAALSASTVKSHRRRIQEKAGGTLLEDLVRVARERAHDATFALARLQLP